MLTETETELIFFYTGLVSSSSRFFYVIEVVGMCASEFFQLTTLFQYHCYFVNNSYNYLEGLIEWLPSLLDVVGTSVLM